MLALSTNNSKRSASFHHGSLQEALVKAAGNLVERDGPAAVSLREAARIAGVSHNAPYRHFPTREALLAAVATQGFFALRDAFNQAATSPGSFLLALGQTYVTFASKNPGLFRLMFGSGLDRHLYSELNTAANDAFNVLLQAATDRGSEAPREAALGAWALAHGLAHLTVDNQLPEDQREEAVSGRLLERISKVYGLRNPS